MKRKKPTLSKQEHSKLFHPTPFSHLFIYLFPCRLFIGVPHKPLPGPFTLLMEDTLFFPSQNKPWFDFFISLYVSQWSKDFKMMLLYISEAMPSIGELPWWQKPDKSPNAGSKLGPPRRLAQPKHSPMSLSVFHPQQWDPPLVAASPIKWLDWNRWRMKWNTDF